MNVRAQSGDAKKPRAMWLWSIVPALFFVAPGAHAQAPAPQGGPPVVRGTEMAGAIQFRAHCEVCHGTDPRAPTVAMLRRMPPERIYQALSTGAMRGQAQEAKFTDKDMRDIAAWMGGRKLEAPQDDARHMPNRCSSSPALTADELKSLPGWNGWSNDLNNARFQPGKAADMSPAAVTRLQLKWAFALPSASSVYGQPAIVGGRIFVSGDSGVVYSLDAASGCVYWSFKAESGVANAVLVEPRPGHPKQLVAYFGDVRGNVYAVDTLNGELLWETRVDENPLSRIRGGMKFYNGRLYVPVASLEEVESGSFNYKCCDFRGMVVALNGENGKQVWKTYTIPDAPTERKTADGKTYLGPSGAGIWGPTMVDPKRKAIYVSTGNSFSEPETGRSDAVIALDMDTGKVLWVQQDEPGDIWHGGCQAGLPPPGLGLPPKSASRFAVRDSLGTAGRAAPRNPPKPPANYYCPPTNGNPDWDFSAGVMMTTMPNGKDLLIVAQKSGVVWAHDPDNKGALVYKSDISRGEIVFGGAMDSENAYFGMRGGALVAMRLSDGLERWATYVAPQESMGTHRGITAAVTAIPGVVFTAGLDGMVRAFSSFDGREIWSYDTTKQVQTVNGFTASGGSIGSAGPTVAGGMLLVTSGYTGFQQGQPGNLLLSFGPPSQ
jgi:polyvinyl alcohol dehydrogenase (cytochrome)